jgi:hypothetical protein
MNTRFSWDDGRSQLRDIDRETFAQQQESDVQLLSMPLMHARAVRRMTFGGRQHVPKLTEFVD